MRTRSRTAPKHSKSAATVASYTEGVLAFLRWSAAANVTPEITKTTVQAFTADLLDAGAQAATARTRHMALRRFAAWLTDEGELDSNPLLGVNPPQLDTKVVETLTDEQLRLLIKACAGKELIDRRDEAIVRLMAETGLRAGGSEGGLMAVAGWSTRGMVDRYTGASAAERAAAEARGLGLGEL